MARLRRLAIDQQLHHVVHRAPAGGQVSRGDADRADFLDALLTVSRESRVSVHAYVILPDRVHLLMTPQLGPDISRLMQRLGRRYVGAFNARHSLGGTPWSGRFRCTVLQPRLHLVDAMRHIETAPVVAGLVERADKWEASSATHHFGRRIDPLVTDHPEYFALGNTPFEREGVYRALCDIMLPSACTGAIDAATESGWVLGDAEFVKALTARQARRLQPQRRGRSSKKSEDDSDPI